MSALEHLSRDRFEILNPDHRWRPSDTLSQDAGIETLLPPLVEKIRRKVHQWRDDDYAGASETSKALLNYWFSGPHYLDEENSNFRYYFSQREAMESIIWVYEVAAARDKYELIKYSSSENLSPGMFPAGENWPRYVTKMATGSGKTKVISLAIAWSYFHKLYEEESGLSRNILLIAPNIIVLDRLYTDFKDASIFDEDPILPGNGYEGRNWQDDFRITVHRQDDVRVQHPYGNIFLTNIHRVFNPDDKNIDASSNPEERILGPKPAGKTTDSKIDLGEIVRDVDELMIINDEAHHIHDPDMAWFLNIVDINNHLIEKKRKLSLQLDFTATPKNKDGKIFVQTISDYPLVEAIHQRVVKRPVVPDDASEKKLKEKKTVKFSRRYEDYIRLGVEEWRKAFAEHAKANKKAILFVMADDIKNCEEVADYLESTYKELKGKVLVIHTRQDGKFSSSITSEKELEELREAARTIDKDDTYRAVLSVLVLREGWDVRNVTTIVGLRAYTSASRILPEQTLGRGLRLMYPDPGEGGVDEQVSVIGTKKFHDFVKELEREGVRLDKQPMGPRTLPKTPVMIEVDKSKGEKKINEYDIELPILSARLQRDFSRYKNLNLAKMAGKTFALEKYTSQKKRTIVFVDSLSGKFNHKTILHDAGEQDYTEIIYWFTETVMRHCRLFDGESFHVLRTKMKEFITRYVFKKKVQLADKQVLQNLIREEVIRHIQETFVEAINKETLTDQGMPKIIGWIKVRDTRPFPVTVHPSDGSHVTPKHSAFNLIYGDSELENQFAVFLDKCDDIISFAKNYIQVGFKLEYANAKGDLSHYHPDFFVKTKAGHIYIIETKGREDVVDSLKINRLKEWCTDVNALLKKDRYRWLYVKQEIFEKYPPKSFNQLVKICQKDEPAKGFIE